MRLSIQERHQRTTKKEKILETHVSKSWIYLWSSGNYSLRRGGQRKMYFTRKKLSIIKSLSKYGYKNLVLDLNPAFLQGLGPEPPVNFFPQLLSHRVWIRIQEKPLTHIKICDTGEICRSEDLSIVSTFLAPRHSGEYCRARCLAMTRPWPVSTRG
jgi:hypothetical protein